MCETWLRPNRRAILFACVPQLAFFALGLWVALGTTGAVWLRWVGAVLAAVAALAITTLLTHLRRPRIALANRELLFNLRFGPPLAVPVHIVEAFFLGQGPTKLPGDAQSTRRTVNLVARLAQRETEWAQREVKPALGSWCDGYITLRGTWCEPLDNELVRRLNRRLKEATTAATQADSP